MVYQYLRVQTYLNLMTVEELCSSCGKKVQVGKAGSLTQWIFTQDSCDCQKKAVQEAGRHKAQICEVCGKEKGDSRLGSLTHWVFSADRCRCLLDQPGHLASQPPPDPYKAARPFVTDIEPVLIKRLEQGGIDYHGLAADSFPFSRYRIIDLIGKGGAGVVYDAWDCVLKKRVAIKTMSALTWSSEEIMRFQSEARAASRLAHANVLQTYDFGVSDNGQPYMVMEFVNGKNLAQILSEESRLKQEEALPIFIKICEGVFHAHKVGLYHRDLKPANIMVADRERRDELTVKVIDFGIAALAQAKTVVDIQQGDTIAGSPAYMSADQIKGLQFDERSDIYSIGCVMFETICGVVPYSASNAMATLSLHATAEVPYMRDFAIAPEEIRETLDDIVHKCLAKERAERYQSVEELLIDLRLEHDSQRARSPEGSPSASDKLPELELRVLDSNPVLSKTAIAFIVVALLSSGYLVLKAVFNWTNPATVKTGTVELFDDITPPQSENRGSKHPEDPFASLSTQNTIIKYVPHRNTLTVDGVGSVDKVIYTALKEDKQIDHLELYGMTISDEGLRALSKLKGLRELFVCDLTVENNASWLIIGDCVNLTQLRYTDGDVTGEFLEKLARLPNLRRLELDACTLSRKGLSALQHSRVNYLSLKVTPLSHENVDEILKIKQLNCLFLGDTGITGSDVKRLTELSNLVTIGINGSPITDETLMSFQKLPHLRLIYGFRCLNLTPGGIQRFKDKNRKVLFVNDENDLSRTFVPQ